RIGLGVLAPPERVCRETTMNPIIRKLHEAQLRKDLPEFRPGDSVRVNVRLKEGEGEKEKERLQAFEGVVISKKGRASSVRRVKRLRIPWRNRRLWKPRRKISSDILFF